MIDPEASELLSEVLDGEANTEDRTRLLAWLRDHPDERGDVAGQIAMNGLLGIALENGDGEDFRKLLIQRLEVEEKRNVFRRLQVTLRRQTRRMSLVAGPLLAMAAWFGIRAVLDRSAADPAPVCWTAAVLALCAVWWMFGTIPVAVTSMIPLLVFPLTGVMDERHTGASYCHPLVLLFFTGFVLSRAMEQRGTHRRVALAMVRLIGGSSGRRLVLGFMIASAGISMWTSNTVTVLMLMPAALAVIDQSRGRRLATPLLLGIAYAAAIGGMGTPIGTPPNGVFIAQADLLVMEGKLAAPFGFIDWMKVGLPVMVIMIPVAWLWLTRGPWPESPIRMTPAGPWTKAEARLSIVLGLTVLLWITRGNPGGGWSGLPGLHDARDYTVGLVAVIALFLIPSGEPEGGALLDWERAADVPWGILFLLGGGIAIGNAFAATGLSTLVAGNLTQLAGLPVLPLLLVIALAVSLLTEFSSNTATATVLLPLLAATAVAAKLPPVLLLLPATLANSCAFMLPTGTPPNAIIFAVGEFGIPRMIWEGLVLKVLCVIVITLVSYVVLG